MVWFEHYGHDSNSETQLNIPVVPTLSYHLVSGLVSYHLVWFVQYLVIICYGLESIL